MGIIVSRCEDPHEPISTTKCRKGFERCSCEYPRAWSDFRGPHVLQCFVSKRLEGHHPSKLEDRWRQKVQTAKKNYAILTGSKSRKWTVQWSFRIVLASKFLVNLSAIFWVSGWHYSCSLCLHSFFGYLNSVHVRQWGARSCWRAKVGMGSFRQTDTLKKHASVGDEWWCSHDQWWWSMSTHNSWTETNLHISFLFPCHGLK